ncbi:YlxR family protein [uncultured Microbacterium sp.]|uniref:YlxR family protein n=1 Tax=uncultured Microbacterium sp. TaxID=191216 RepID=UPI0025E83E8D|nr:YlxR family protein [uncultured Microbacterium sp.]
MEPVRTCVGCRARSARSTLLRVVVKDGVLVPDERAVLPGRGAWLHLSSTCLARALKSRAFVRSLRLSNATTPVAFDTEALEILIRRNG